MATYVPESSPVPVVAISTAGAALEAVFAALFPHPDVIYSLFSGITSVPAAT